MKDGRGPGTFVVTISSLVEIHKPFRACECMRILEEENQADCMQSHSFDPAGTQDDFMKIFSSNEETAPLVAYELEEEDADNDDDDDDGNPPPLSLESGPRTPRPRVLVPIPLFEA